MKRRALTFIPALLLGALPIVGAPSIACAGEGARAALVVDTGSAVTSYCVELDAPSVSGIRLIELASSQHGLEYSLGFGGKAVCMLEGVGPMSDDCFEEYPDYWGYWRGDGSGGWRWSSSGAGSTSVSDGDVEGWSWGSGQDGSTHPSPPSTPFGSVCAPRAGSGGEGSGSSGNDGGSKPAKKSSAPETPGGDEEPASAPKSRNKSAGGAKGNKSEKRKPGATKERWDRRRAEVTPEPGPTAVPLAIGSTRSTSESGPPPAGVAALAGSLLLGGSALVLAHRRKRS